MQLGDRLQRIAFARLISDLIEADFIIEDNEMSFYEEINERYRISNEMLIEAKKKNFEWSINTLKSLSIEQKNEIKQILRDLSLSDGTCVPNEALQIMAALFALDDKGEVFSIPSTTSYVFNMKVLYIENQDGTPEDEYISKNLRSICNMFNLSGFDFVYIPKIAEEYKSMGEEYLKKTIKYMIPSITPDMVTDIQNNLCSITTSRFCREILRSKMGINVLGCKPSLLFKIGESYVVGAYNHDESDRQAYSNFLRIEIEENLLQQIIGFVDVYRKLVSPTSIVEVHPVSNKFLYSGFHRSLFDLIAFCKERVDYRIVINIRDRREPAILFKALDNVCEPEEVKLTPLATALYILMIQQSIFGDGLDWRENPGKEDKERILAKFNTLYGLVGNRNDAVDYKDRILASRIKKELKRLQSSVSNLEIFVPELRTINGNSIYTVPVPSDFVYVIEQGEEIKMSDSERWKTL